MGRRVATGTNVRSTYDRLAPDYDSLYLSNEDRAEDAWLARYITRRLLPAGAVLDVGCGTGWFLDHVEVGGAYVGLDTSLGMIREAKRKHGRATRQFVLGTMLEPWCPQVGGGYDLVVSTYCSASYAPPAWAAEQAFDVLAPGGRVLFMPHAHGNARRPPHLPDEAYTPAPGEYYEFWEADEAADELSAHGFRDVRVVGMRHPTKSPGRLAPLWAHRAWLVAEHATVGRRHPDRMTFLLAEGIVPT